MSKESANRIKKWFAEGEGRPANQRSGAGRISVEWADYYPPSLRLSQWDPELPVDHVGPYVTLPPMISPEAVYAKLMEVRQAFVEINVRDLMTSFDRLSEFVKPQERTVAHVSHLIGVDDQLGDILYMTGRLFDAPARLSVGEVHPLSLVVTVSVGDGADVSLSRQRERAWYENLTGIAPQAEGRVFLFVSYE